MPRKVKRGGMAMSPEVMKMYPRPRGVRGKGFFDFFKKIGNRDTWDNIGNKIITAVKQPIENVKNLARATKDAANSMGDSTNWRNMIRNPNEWSKKQLTPWLQNNKVISSALGTFLSPGMPLPLNQVLENGTRAVGFGLKRKRTVKRKRVGGKLF